MPWRASYCTSYTFKNDVSTNTLCNTFIFISAVTEITTYQPSATCDGQSNVRAVASCSTNEPCISHSAPCWPGWSHKRPLLVQFWSSYNSVPVFYFCCCFFVGGGCTFYVLSFIGLFKDFLPKFYIYLMVVQRCNHLTLISPPASCLLLYWHIPHPLLLRFSIDSFHSGSDSGALRKVTEHLATKG